MRHVAKPVLAATCLIALSGCGKWNPLNRGQPTPSPAPTPPPAGKVVCVLVDRSSSTKEQGVRQRYIESFRRILDKLGTGDIIVADAITDNPLAQSSFPVNDEFETFQPGTDNPLIVKKKQEEHEGKLREKRDQVWDKAQGLFAGAPSKQTKIFDALRLAERVFHTYQRQKKVLVIFSDMVEESERHNFTRERLTEAASARIISEEKEAKRLPDLNGVKVYVIGAGQSGNRSSSSEQYAGIQSFWLQYFKSAGADLPKERYGAALLKFDE